MSALSLLSERYPCSLPVAGGELHLRPMTAADADEVLAFARALPHHDLLFVRRDITQDKVMRAWIAQIEDQQITSLLAHMDDTLVGCTALLRDQHSFSPHVGELRVLVSADVRAHGVGRVLIQEGFYQSALWGLEKLTAQMTADQAAAIAVFESMGFRAEALLRDHVRDDDGTTHDIVILSRDIASAEAQLRTLGLDEPD